MPKCLEQSQFPDLADLYCTEIFRSQDCSKSDSNSDPEKIWDLISFGIPSVPEFTSRAKAVDKDVSGRKSQGPLPPPQKFPRCGIRRCVADK